MGEECCGGDHENLTVEDLAHHSNDKIDALIELLITKKIITEEEFGKEFESLYEEEEKLKEAESTKEPELEKEESD